MLFPNAFRVTRVTAGRLTTVGRRCKLAFVHLQQLPSGRWRVIVQHAGRKRTGSAATRIEAQQVGAELLLELGGSTKISAMTVAELMAQWFLQADLSATYEADARRVIERLPDEFSSRPIVEVTPSVIEGLYRQLARAGWSAHRVRRLHTVLSSAWTMARRYEWAIVNPFSAARAPTPPKRAIAPPTPAQVLELLDSAPERLALYLELSAVLGARRGEVVGLQWHDITGDSISVRRSIAYSPTTGLVITDGKTGAKGHRVVAITNDLVEALRAHRVSQVEMALAAGLPSPVWVFSHDAGVTPWRPDYISREFRRHRRRAGLDHSFRLHDLRHFVATQLLAAGVPLKTVSERLGHRQLSTTSDRYGHWVPAADKAAADTIGSILRPQRAQ